MSHEMLKVDLAQNLEMLLFILHLPVCRSYICDGFANLWISISSADQLSVQYV